MRARFIPTKILLVACACLWSAAAARAANVVLKDFRQIYASWIAATGLNGTDPDLAQTFAMVRSRLPKSGDIHEMTPPSILAAGTLASAICAKMISRDAALGPAARRTHKAIDFTQGPGAVNAAARAATAQDYAITFWQRPAADAEVDALAAVMARAEAALGHDPAATGAMLRVTCVAAATSIEGLIR